MDKCMKIYKFIIIVTLFFLTTFILKTGPLASDPKVQTNMSRADSRITFNFVDVEIPAIIKFISEITGYNFIFDEKVRGKITIVAPTELSVDESFSLFTSVLNLKGFTVVPTTFNSYKIIPSSLAKQAGMIHADEKLPVNERYITKLLLTEHIKAEDTLQFLRPVVSRDGHISAFGPGNLLLVVDSAINIDKITTILKLIDKPSIKEEQAQINVHFLEHADATDLAKVLQGIIKDLKTHYKTARRPKKNGQPQQSPVLSVTPDISTNSLVIVAPPEDYKNLAKVIKTLDRKRKQVYVEAMIIEASIDKLRDLGTKWRITARHEGEPVVIGGFGNVSSSTILDIITGLTGFSTGGMGNFLDIPVTSLSAAGTLTNQTLTSPGFAALFSMNEFQDAINVLSTPQILTSDNEEAEILVGENVPFISARTDAATTNSILNSIERTDVGIKLNITPQITEGDYVKLDIFQSIEAVKDASDEILTTVGPTTTKRATKTSVVVKDGRTVVIGGLMQEREEEVIQKTPILGDIPILGWFFKFKSVSKVKNNLLVFLSPHIIKESPQLAGITEEKHVEFMEKEKFYNQGELLIKFKEGISRDKAQEILSRNGATVVKYFKEINVYLVKIKHRREIEDAINKFTSIPDILYAEPNYKFKLQKSPSGLNQGSENQTAPLINNKSDMIIKQNPSASLQLPPKKKIDDISLKENASQFKNKTVVNQNIYTYSNPSLKQPENTDDAFSANVTESQPLHDTENTTLQKTEHLLSLKKTLTDMPRNDKYLIQVGAWRNVEFAEETLGKLRSSYPEIYIVKEDNFHKVRIPGIMTKKQVSIISTNLQEDFNLSSILVQKRE
jgi:general secretion pathway protein D